MKLTENYSIKFLADGSDTLTFELTDPPLSLDFGGKDPSALVNADFRPVSQVPAAPFMKDCTLSGTTVTATFAKELPEIDISQQPAIYSLAFDLQF